MTYKVVISNSKKTFPLKGLNELINGRMHNPRTDKWHNPVKKHNDEVCLKAIKKQMPKVTINKPIKCTFFVYAQDMKHDRGNLTASCEKWFLDALQQAGGIGNDGWNFVYDSVFYTEVDRKNPRVEVLIQTVGK